MRSKLAVAALVVVVVAGVVAISLSGGSSKHPAQVSATPAPTTAAPTETVSPGGSATHHPPLRSTPGPTRPTLHLAPRSVTPPVSASPFPAAAICRLVAGPQPIGGRTVILDLPNRFPAPVVIDFHGGNQSAAQEHGYTGLGPAGASRGFVVATPDGTNGRWNFSGAEPLPDDAAFTRTLSATLRFAGCSDGRLYAAGISDGADMAVAAGCRVTEVRAVFAVAPSITPRGPCTRKPLVEVHGTADPIVPYSASAAGSFGDVPSEPVAARLPFWTSGCSGPGTGIRPAAGTQVQVWSCPGGRTVQLDTVNGGGHTWPGAAGAEPAAGLGARAPWSADSAALNFFAGH
jgi:polyhydroxybutyrate depolymerase